MGGLKKIGIIFACLVCLLGFSVARAASDDVKEEILQLNDSVQEKKDRLDDLQKQINEYKSRISQAQTKAITLQNQISLLENRAAKTALDIESKEVEIEKVRLEMTILSDEIGEKEKQLQRGRGVLGDLLREIKVSDNRNIVAIVLGNETFSEFFAQVNYLLEVQNKLQGTLDDVTEIKTQKEERLTERVNREKLLEDLKIELEKKQYQYEDEQGTKAYLLAVTQQSETEYQSLLKSLRAESQLIDNEVSALESKISDRLQGLDFNLGGGAVLSYPLDGDNFITATFHDPTYPYRHLFEHSGIDLRAKAGTPVMSVAPGVVAVARTGNLYGNYVIILHGNNLATLYAHLSRINVSVDQVVQRGDVIGKSGGARGMQGAGLSTGPHLHFEVRSNGVPVNPMSYLINL